MRIRKVSPTGDFVFGNSNLDYWVDAPDGVALLVKNRLQLWLGEFFLDTTDGTPYLEGVLQESNQGTADFVLLDRISSTPNVTEVISFSSSVLNRQLSVNSRVNTTFGQTQLQLVL